MVYAEKAVGARKMICSYATLVRTSVSQRIELSEVVKSVRLIVKTEAAKTRLLNVFRLINLMDKYLRHLQKLPAQPKLSELVSIANDPELPDDFRDEVRGELRIIKEKLMRDEIYLQMKGK
jgi:hypothetical protein